MNRIAEIGRSAFFMSVFCALIAYGVTLGKAVAAEFSPPTTAEQYKQILGEAAKASGVPENSVRVWTPENSAAYERFWSAVEFSHNFYVSSENWLPRSFGGGGGDDGEGEGEAESDIRLKRSIEHLATLKNGIKIYSFKYHWDDTVHVGVMAQHLLADPVHREAVTLRPNGFYTVNYAMLGLRMTTLGAWRENGLAAVMQTPASGRQVSTFALAPKH